MSDGPPSVAPGLTRTGLRFLATLGVVTLVWVVLLAPGYDRTIAQISVFLARMLESPDVTRGVRMEGSEAVVERNGVAPDVPEQRLELRTHHNNAPLLIALILAMPGLTRPRRERTLLIGMTVLAATHVLHFLLEVHLFHAVTNIGPYRVTDMRYLGRGFWQSLDNPAQAAKSVLPVVEAMYTHVGRRVMPLLIWMTLCWDGLRTAASTR